MTKTYFLGIALLGALAASTVHAQTPRYDKKLEAAAARIVAENIGDIRTGFDVGEQPKIYPASTSKLQRIQRGYSLGSFQWAGAGQKRK